MVDERSLMLQPILPARWANFSEYPVTKFVTEWSFIQRGSVFATSAAMHALSGHVVARLGWPFAVRYEFTRIYDFRSQYLIVLIAPKAILAMA